MGLFFILSCDYKFSLDKGLTDIKQRVPKIYFEETNQFIDIKTLNRENRTLRLYDQIIFSNERDFLNNKESFFNLELLDQFTKTEDIEDIKVKVSSFCSHSKTDLQALEKTDRVFQEWASSSFHLSFSIVDLLPHELLLRDLDKTFYCSFIFAFRENTQKSFTHYNIAQQSIQADFSDNYTNKLALIQETSLGYKYAPANYIVQRGNIKNTLLLNNTDQAATNYELFCEGEKMIDIPDFRLNLESVFAHLTTIKTLPMGRKNCRFVSRNNGKITGITRSFLLDFHSLGMKSERVDLSQITAPVFVDISEKDVYPESFEARYDLPDWVKDRFRKRSPAYISSENSLALNAYISFKNLDSVALSYPDYSSIEIILETECWDANSYLENNFFGYGEVVSTVTQLPFREKIPIASALPLKVFDMGQAYDQWLRELIKLQREIDRSAKSIAQKTGFREQTRIFQERYLDQLEKESELENMRHQITCLYKIKLEDQYDPQNKVEFKTESYRILWTRDAYGMSYTAFPEGQDPFITLEQQANTDRLRFESIRLNSIMGYLNLTFFDLIETPVLQKEGYELDRFVLRCTAMENQTKELELSWPYSPTINNQIVLKDLFSHPDFQAYIEEKEKVACRVLFYEGDLLRYFSGEARVR